MLIVDFRINDTLHNGRGDLAPTGVGFVIGVWDEMSHYLLTLLYILRTLPSDDLTFFEVFIEFTIG